MNAVQTLDILFGLSDMLVTTYLSDLSDAEILERPDPACNRLAWQLGHLISSEKTLREKSFPNAPKAELSAGFAEAHAADRASAPGTEGLLTKEAYLAEYQKQRAATKAIYAALSPEDLDRESPEDFRAWCPTVGSMLVLIADHYTMHMGQFVVVRRRLGKPVLI